jgi:endonuclease YncB( thermonuclease family)
MIVDGLREVHTPACANVLAKVVRVKDGDTIVVLRGTEKIDIRLEGIGLTKG